MNNEMHMRTLVCIGVLLGFLFFDPPRANAKPPTLHPAAHEELGTILDEFTTHLKGLGTLWHRHFLGRDSYRKRPLITFMLQHRDELELSTVQVENLKRLRASFQREAIRRQADIRVAEMELETLLDAATVDLEQVEAKIRQIEKLRSDRRLARIQTIEKGKAQLTLAQGEKLRILIAKPY